MDGGGVEKLGLVLVDVETVGDYGAQYQPAAHRSAYGVDTAESGVFHGKTVHHLQIHVVGGVAVPTGHLCHGGGHAHGFFGIASNDGVVVALLQECLELGAVGVGGNGVSLTFVDGDYAAQLAELGGIAFLEREYNFGMGGKQAVDGVLGRGPDIAKENGDCQKRKFSHRK